MSRIDPLDDARALLVCARLILRARRREDLNGVQLAGEAYERLVPLGQALASAVETAEAASLGPERVRALVEVARLGQCLAADVDPNWEGLRGVVAESIAGVQGNKPRRPGT